MSNQNTHSTWVKYPTGKIGKGEFCQECGRYNTRNVTVHSILFDQNKVLLIKRANNPQKDFWALPAGYLDWDETLEEGALRELKEETNLDGSIVSLSGVYSNTNRDEDGRQNIAISYIVKFLGSPQAGDDASEVNWFEIENLPENIAFDHKKMILDAFMIYTKDDKA